MRKLLALICVVALLLSMTACGQSDGGTSNNESTETESVTNPVEDISLSDILDDILQNVPDLPGYEATELTEENFEFYTFVPCAEGYEGLAAEAMIGSIAHSVVLVEVPDGTDASTVAANMQSNANPNKWICVTAESVQTAVKGQLVLLVMSLQTIADAVVANFNAL